MSPDSPTVKQHFVGRAPEVLATYKTLLAAAKKFGPIEEEPKKTSIHLARRTAFAGIATRKDALILTVKAASDIRSPRVLKREKVSANRWHVEFRLDSPKQVDAELRGWLREAYALAE